MGQTTGTLYICATPIGNMEDITVRVLRILKEVDLIIAEDTRRTLKLLNYYDIKKPVESCHRHNEKKKMEFFLKKLQAGESIALVSDAGTPIISDPGEEFVKLCINNNIQITSLPGPSAVIDGLVLSGLPAHKFSFEGFLPINKGKRLNRLQQIKNDTRTLVFYEAPHKLPDTLKDMLSEFGDRKAAICRELTKIHEEVVRCTISQAIEMFKDLPPKGEFVIIVEGINEDKIKNEEAEEWALIPIDKHLDYLISNGYDKKQAIKKIAAQRGMGKRDIYKMLINKSGK